MKSSWLSTAYVSERETANPIWSQSQTPRLAENNRSAFNFIQLMNYTIWKEWAILNSPLHSTGTEGRGDKATDHLQ